MDNNHNWILSKQGKCNNQVLYRPMHEILSGENIQDQVVMVLANNWIILLQP